MCFKFFLLCVFFLGHLERYGCLALRIEITPSKCIAITQETVNISCLLDDDDIGKEIALMELLRNNEEPLVVLRQCGNVALGNDALNRLQTAALIAKDKGQGYLNVTLMNPDSHDTGIYTCRMYHIDQASHLKMDTATGNLLVENLDVTSLETALVQMKDRIISLEKENHAMKTKDQDATSLETALNQMKDRIATLEEENHDLKTKASGIWIFLRVNRNNALKLKTGDKDYTDQSSINLVTKLSVGDQVEPLVHRIDGTRKIYGDRYSAFSGYLIQLL